MPSYIGHIACGEALIKKLHLSSEDETKFMIGNLIPDIKQVDIDYTLDEFINKKNIQRSKRITHFRKKTNKILEYPHCRIFLEKYEKDVVKHVETFAYFFHLYTDYYYFKYFLPKVISFYTVDFKEVDERDMFYYVKVHKSGEYIKASNFFSKLKQEGLYKEYYRSNYYLIHKYKLNIHTKELKEYLDLHSFCSYVDEVNMDRIQDIFHKIDRVYRYAKDDELLIFEEKQLDTFIKNVVKSFMEEYGYLIENYL